MILHSILLIGQSNMAGRGDMSQAEPLAESRLKVLKNGRWQKAFRPVNYDRPFAGVNLAEYFAEEYIRDHDADVGLIPCADGGTSLDQWHVGGLLYDHAVAMARLASRTSTIAAVLWHQGETDCYPDRWPYYAEKFRVIVEGFRRDLPIGDVPFLVGGLGDFLKDCPHNPPISGYDKINEQLREIAASTPMMGYVPADGLTSKQDLLHFDTAALKTFGRRYYNVFCTLEDHNKEFPDKPGEDAAIRSDLELL